MQKSIIFAGKVVAKSYSFPVQLPTVKQPVKQEHLYKEFWNIKE